MLKGLARPIYWRGRNFFLVAVVKGRGKWGGEMAE